MRGIAASISAVLLLGAALLGRGSNAEPQALMVRGFGPNSCGKFLATTSSFPAGQSGHMFSQGVEFWSTNESYFEWLNGFITYANLTVPALAGPNQITVDGTAIDYWMRQWCSTNPTSGFYEGAIAFVASEVAKRKNNDR